ncbi:unnamed protein product [Ambrosiozyma monospora]|uniref:Unnamed protein product n=1 Tax=Ambrosiozyma monospora TaxID=43982 RepID=A0ACB5T9U0_AMBMO|nr:unnamed protein product [Ambrosiozyma monospora]
MTTTMSESNIIKSGSSMSIHARQQQAKQLAQQQQLHQKQNQQYPHHSPSASADSTTLPRFKGTLDVSALQYNSKPGLHPNVNDDAFHDSIDWDSSDDDDDYHNDHIEVEEVTSYEEGQLATVGKAVLSPAQPLSTPTFDSKMPIHESEEVLNLNNKSKSSNSFSVDDTMEPITKSKPTLDPSSTNRKIGSASNLRSYNNSNTSLKGLNLQLNLKQSSILSSPTRKSSEKSAEDFSFVPTHKATNSQDTEYLQQGHFEGKAMNFENDLRIMTPQQLHKKQNSFGGGNGGAFESFQNGSSTSLNHVGSSSPRSDGIKHVATNETAAQQPSIKLNERRTLSDEKKCSSFKNVRI